MENNNNLKIVKRFFLIWILGVLIPLIILNLIKTFFLYTLMYSTNFELILFLIGFVFIQLIIISGLLYFLDKETYQSNKISFFKWIGISFIFSLGFVFILNILVKLPYLIGGSYQVKNLISENISQFNSLPFPFIITILIVSLSAVFEEILFRGFLQRNLLKFFNSIGAILITSFIFTLFHFQINNFYPILFLGVFLWLIYHKFWLKTVILTHLFINLFSSSFLYFNNSVYNNLWFNSSDFSNKPNFLAMQLNKDNENYLNWYEIYLPENKLIYKKICLENFNKNSSWSLLNDCLIKNKESVNKELEDSINILEKIKKEDTDNLEEIMKIIEENKNTIDLLENKE